MFSTHEMKYIERLQKSKSFFLFFTFYRLHAMSRPAENAKTKYFSKLKYCWFQNTRHVLTKKKHIHIDVFVTNKKFMGV